MRIIFEHVWLNEDLDVIITKHGEERSKERYGKEVNIQKSEIEDIIQRAIENIKKYTSRFRTFVLYDIKSGINVITRIIQKGKDLIAKVITVMKKKNFKPYPEDKYLEDYEGIEFYVRNDFFTFNDYKKLILK